MSSSLAIRHVVMLVTGAAALAAASVWLLDPDRRATVRRRPAIGPAVAPLPPPIPRPPEPLSMQQIRSIEERARRGTILFLFSGSRGPIITPPRPAISGERQ
jgi:hypothetical protein